MPELVRCEQCGRNISTDAARKVDEAIMCPPCVEIYKAAVAKVAREKKGKEELQRRVEESERIERRLEEEDRRTATDATERAAIAAANATHARLVSRAAADPDVAAFQRASWWMMLLVRLLAVFTGLGGLVTLGLAIPFMLTAASLSGETALRAGWAPFLVSVAMGLAGVLQLVLAYVVWNVAVFVERFTVLFGRLVVATERISK